MNREPLWELLEQDEFIDLLFHVKGHGDILKKMKPKSILELAAILAMIRPSKRYLIGKPWDKVFEEIWLPDAQGEYAFKKSHSVAYATLIAVQMNLICETV
jgi:DNA polymerase III alpha subunit